MKNLLTFDEFVNESRLNESGDVSPLKEWANNYANELVQFSGANQNKAKSFIAEIVKAIEKYFKTGSNNLVIDYDNYDFDEDNAKKVAQIEGKKYGLDSDTVDYYLIEEDGSGNLWLTVFADGRGDALCVRKK